MDEMVRIKLVDALKPVDYCFLSGHTPIHHPLEFLETVFNELKPNIYVVNEDASDIPYRKELRCDICNSYKIENAEKIKKTFWEEQKKKIKNIFKRSS